MSITERSVLPHGTRVKVIRGRFPSDPSSIGRMGTVMEHSVYYPNKVDVAMDGNPAIRTFAPDEIEVVEGPESVPPDHEAAKKRLARP